MHEQSLVKSLLRQVDEILDLHCATVAKTIVVELGPLSGVEPELVRSAFAILSPASRSAGGELIIKEIALVIRCLDCSCETELDSFVFRCGRCGFGNVEVARGDAFRLLTVTVDQPDAAPGR